MALSLTQNYFPINRCYNKMIIDIYMISIQCGITISVLIKLLCFHALLCNMETCYHFQKRFYKHGQVGKGGGGLGWKCWYGGAANIRHVVSEICLFISFRKHVVHSKSMSIGHGMPPLTSKVNKSITSEQKSLKSNLAFLLWSLTLCIKLK